MVGGTGGGKVGLRDRPAAQQVQAWLVKTEEIPESESQVNSPQVSRWGDGVALRTQLLCSLWKRAVRLLLQTFTSFWMFCIIFMFSFLPAFEANTPHSERASTGWRWAALCRCPAHRNRQKQVSNVYLQCNKAATRCPHVTTIRAKQLFSHLFISFIPLWYFTL